MLEKRKIKTGRQLFFLAVFLLAGVLFLFHLDWQDSHRDFTFAMLNVGQGDALFIESPTGTQVMFDTGPAHSVLGSLQKIVLPFDRTIDAIVITNPDADHLGGAMDVLKKYKVGAVFESGALTDTKIFQNFREEIKKQNIPDILARKGMSLNIGGGIFIDILFPDRDVAAWATNDGSVVARLTYGDISIMLTGDATAKTEKIILAENSVQQLKSTILKVGHHGSRSSSFSSFTKAVSPTYAFISVGEGNKYGHPHQETLATLTQFGVKILRTDLLGNIILKCDRINKCAIN